MNQTSYSPDKFGTYLSHPGSQGCDIDLSSANVLEILLAYRAFRQTLNASYSNENIVRKVRQLEKEWDTFVLLCNLGQRYSDIVRISPENFERYITFDED